MDTYDRNGTIISVNTTYPETYGAVGDGTTDDTSAIQQAVDNCGRISFKTGATYRITDTIRLKGETTLDLNGATLLSETKHLLYNFLTGDTMSGYVGNGNIVIKNGTIIHGAISFIHAENVLLDNVSFKDSINDHYLEICACKNYIVRNCSFVGINMETPSFLEYINIDPCDRYAFPWNTPDIASFYDGTINIGITIDGCYFSIGTGDYAKGYNAIGVHSPGGNNHQDIKIVNNKIRGFVGCGLRLNTMSNIFVGYNDIQVDGDGIRVGDVKACDDITIINNYIVSENGSRIALTDGAYTNLTVSRNVAKGDNDLAS